MPIKIAYGSPAHNFVKTQIVQRKKLSEKKMSEFHKQWNDAEDSMRAYIHERDLDKKRKTNKQYAGEVDYVTLEVPYTYAIIMTAHTYYSSVMLSRAPLWQFTARHGEGQDSVMAVEAVMDYQSKVGNHLPVLYNWLYDLARYSLGVVGCYWDEEEKVVTTMKEVQNSIMGIPFGGMKKVETQEIVKGYCGNKLYNTRVYDFFPDPRVPIWRFQEGEFCIRQTIEGYHNLISGQQADPDRYFNLEKLKDLIKSDNGEYVDGSPQVNMPMKPGEDAQAPGAGYCNITEAYVRLIPSMWKLGSSNRQEIWCFELANSEVIISARPLGLYHDRFPFAVLEGNFGSEEFAKFGMLEVIRPMTDILTWLVNSHFYNVRKILNNQLIVDPSRIVMKDLTGKDSRIIRLRPEAYGQDVRSFVTQLQQVDITKQHMTDVNMVEGLIQRVSAVVDNVMGTPQRGGRKTATEVRDASGWSISRLKTPVEYNSSLGFDPLSQMMLSNTQQLLQVERKYAIAGNTLDQAQAFLDVNSQRIAGCYDFVPVEGTMPVDRLAQANFWKELIVQMARSPQLAMQWDLNAMIAHTMKMQGERNIDRFKIKMGSPEQLQQQAAAGNVIPLPGAGNGTGSPRATRGERATAGSSGGTI